MKTADIPEKNTVVFRNHPIIMIDAVFLIPLLIAKFSIRDIRSIITGKEKLKDLIIINDAGIYVLIVAAALILLAILVIRAYLVYKNSMIVIGEKTIRYKKYGLFFKKDKESRISNITNVNLNSGIIYGILGIKKVVLDINSSETAEENDYTIVLGNKDAEKFRKVIMERKGEVISPAKAKIADENISLESVKIKRTDEDGSLENVNITDGDTHLERVKVKNFSRSEIIKSIIIEGGLFGLVEIFAVFIAIAVSRNPIFIILALEPIRGYLKKANQMWDFRVERTENHLKIRYGLTEKKDFDIDVKNIIGTGTQQNILAGILKMSAVTIDQIGFGNSDEESNRISLYMNEKDISEYIGEMVPEIRMDGIYSEKKEAENIPGRKLEGAEKISYVKTQKYETSETYLKKPEKLMYYYIIKSVVICEVIGVMIYAVKSSALVFVLTAAIAAAIGATVFSYKRVRVEKDRILMSSGIFSKNRTMIPYKKIESINCSQSIIQKKMNVYSLEIYYRDYKHGKTSESTGLFKEGSFDSIIEYYRRGEK